MSIRLGLVVALVLMAAPGLARAACDPGVAAAGREAIDAGCPCGDFASRGRTAYRKCANRIVRAQVAAALLPGACRRETLRHAKQSTCGRAGSVVCCRVRADGVTRHRVVSDAAHCRPTSSVSACVSGAHSVPSGCDPSGCIASPATTTTRPVTTTTIGLPVCGNGIVEPGEECDPSDGPLGVYCDHECKSLICAPPVTTCGDGTVDAGEACEPPGVGDCAPDCQVASCGMLAAGEIGIACDVASNGGVSAAASPSTYLVGWTELSPPTRSDVVVRRFDVNGAPLDSGRTVLSTDVPCHSSHSSLALASDGKDFYAVWRSLGSTEGDTYFYIDMLGRRVGGSGGVGALDHLDLLIPRGTCQVAYDGPTMAAGVWSRRFSVGWQEYGSCYGSLDFQYPIARVVDLNNMPVSQSLDIGFTPPTGSSVVGPQSGASVAQLGSDTLGADTLWVWHASRSTYPEPSSEHFVTGVFGDLDGADPQVVLSHRNELIGGRPGVAAGASSFLVAWAQGASDDATTVTEIRAVRATRAYPVPRLDPDGGLLLATSSTVITGGPVVAADATRWLVVWAEKSGATNDLRAVAVESDGTVVDASPRLVASDVTAGEPAVASGGGMRVLVVFSRPNGATRDVLAKPLTP